MAPAGIRGILPVFVCIAIVLQYLFVPKAGETTDVFVWFMAVLVLIFIVWNIVALFSKRANMDLQKKSPIITVALILLLAYDILTLTTGILPQPFVPWPDAILNAMIRDRQILTRSVLHSLMLLFTGYGIGVAAGVITGVAAGRSEKVRYWVSLLLKLFGSIPPVTWLPIIIILASSLFSGAVVLIALAVWYPVATTTMNGVLSIPKVTFEAASTFGASKVGMIFKVAVPASLPFIFQGLTQGMSIACTSLLIAEMMGVEAGLGWYISRQRGWADFAGMYAAVVIIAITFFVVNAVLDIIKRRVLRWGETS
ncbi:MAG: ABC transporter permease subunit [Defluviitaleaceae bacterium]|nr:ABC transporter permease subunit [Defluviitaleaceae bacterium]